MEKLLVVALLLCLTPIKGIAACDDVFDPNDHGLSAAEVAELRACGAVEDAPADAEATKKDEVDAGGAGGGGNAGGGTDDAAAKALTAAKPAPKAAAKTTAKK